MRGVRDSAAIHDVLVSGRSELRGGSCRSCAGTAVNEDPTLRANSATFESGREPIDRDANGSRQVACPEFESRSNIHDEVDRRAAKSRGARCGAFHDTLGLRVEMPRSEYNGQNPMAAVKRSTSPT
jgi:hypothetical protein